MIRAQLFRSPGILRPSYITPSAYIKLRTLSTLQNAPRPKVLSLTSKPSNLAIVRYVASSVSSKPPSENLPHALQNAKEEASNLVTDVTKVIAGANFHKGSHEFQDGVVRFLSVHF